MPRPKPKTIILNDDLEYEWKMSTVEKVINLWNEGKSVEDITVAVTPKAEDCENIFFMIRGLRKKNLISDRNGGMYGGRT